MSDEGSDALAGATVTVSSRKGRLKDKLVEAFRKNGANVVVAGTTIHVPAEVLSSMADAPDAEDRETDVGGIAADRLRSIIERVERLEEERKALADDIRDIFAEAKSAGFEPAIIKTIIKLRKQEPAEVEEQETLLDLYRRALGM